MPADTLAKETPPLTGARIHTLLDKARHGDHKAIGELRPLMDAHPELWRQIGDMAYQADQSLIHATAGKDELTIEAMTRKLEKMRAELAGEHPTPLERLLAARIASCWAALAYAETIYHQNMGDLTLGQGDYHQRRIDHCHKRYLGAVKALAVVRRLQLPAVQVNIGERQVNVATAPARG